MKYIVGSKTVTLVNSQDEVQGEMDIFEAHEKPFYLHRASSVWLYKKVPARNASSIADAGGNFKIKVLLQRRSKFKPIGAGQWGNGICANVRPDENYEECAYRRLKGEIGVEGVNLKPIYKFEYKTYGNEKFSEHELDQVFIAEYAGEINSNPDEVSKVIWVEWQELLAKVLENKSKILSAKESLKYSHEQLKKLAPPISIVLTINHQPLSIRIASWTAIMIIDLRLQAALEI